MYDKKTAQIVTVGATVPVLPLDPSPKDQVVGSYPQQAWGLVNTLR